MDHFAYRNLLEKYMWEFPNAFDASGIPIHNEQIAEQTLLNEIRKRSQDWMMELFARLLYVQCPFNRHHQDCDLHLKQLELLIRAGFDLNQPCYSKYDRPRSILIRVLRYGSCNRFVRLLLVNGAWFRPEDFVPTHSNRSRIGRTLINIDVSLLKLLAEFHPGKLYKLIQNDANVDTLVNFYCAHCTFDDMVDGVSSLLELGFPFWLEDSIGWTAVRYLKMRAHIKLKREQGYPLEGPFDQITENPLQFASLLPDSEPMKALTQTYNRLNSQMRWPIIMTRHPRVSHPISRLSVELLQHCLPAL